MKGWLYKGKEWGFPLSSKIVHKVQNLYCSVRGCRWLFGLFICVHFSWICQLVLLSPAWMFYSLRIITVSKHSSAKILPWVQWVMSYVSNGEDGFVQSGLKTSHYPWMLCIWPQWTTEERVLMEHRKKVQVIHLWFPYNGPAKRSSAPKKTLTSHKRVLVMGRKITFPRYFSSKSKDKNQGLRQKLLFTGSLF